MDTHTLEIRRGILEMRREGFTREEVADVFAVERLMQNGSAKHSPPAASTEPPPAAPPATPTNGHDRLAIHADESVTEIVLEMLTDEIVHAAPVGTSWQILASRVAIAMRSSKLRRHGKRRTNRQSRQTVRSVIARQGWASMLRVSCPARARHITITKVAP